MHRMVAKLILVLAVAGAASSAAASQTAAAARQVGQVVTGRGPQFLVAGASRSEPARLDVSSTPALRKNLSLEIDNATIIEALAEISRRAGLNLVYSAEELLPAETRVTLRAEAITVAAALTHVLLDAGVDILFTGRGVVTLVPQPPTDRLPGTIVGRVTEAETDNPIVNAQIAVDGRGRAITDDDGRYRINGVAAGLRTVSVTSIGYARASQEVEVGDDATVTVDFALEVSASQLDQIVVTVTGEQRVRELGHVVGRINADSLVKEAPISSLSELLTGRVPGLQVFQASGAVGGEVTLQVRGPNSILLANEPIVIIDGVRYTANEPPGFSFLGPAQVERTSPLNDLNPNDIASIEVVKGPSAATLYGTEAANGVIVITTKGGQAGSTRWNAYGRAVSSAIPSARQPEQYWGWQTVDGVTSATSSCTLPFGVAAGTCTQDSVAAMPNPFRDPNASIFQTASSWESGVNVSGGTDEITYYFAAALQEAASGVRLPPAIEDALKERQGVTELPREIVRPNTLSALNLRANVAARLGQDADVSLQAGYARNTTRALASFQLSPYSQGTALQTPDRPYGTGVTDPSQSFAHTSTQETDRFFGSMNAQWRPSNWLVTRASVGLDLANPHRESVVRAGDAPNALSNLGQTGMVVSERARQATTTAEVGVTATAQRGSLSSRTSIGAQYVRGLSDGLSISGIDLRPGGTSIRDAAVVQSKDQAYDESVLLGAYVEQVVGLNDRLFLTGAVRADGASTFGRDFDAALYPKAGISWLVSEEPMLRRLGWLGQLRLRYAFGASGRQPASGWAQPLFVTSQAVVDGVVTTVIGLEDFGPNLGNPDLRPERVREHEFGVDASALGGRVDIQATWFRRRTADQILTENLAPGFGWRFTSIGLTSQRGFELEATLRAIETEPVSLDLTVRHAFQRTTLIDLGDAAEVRRVNGGSRVEGYPLGARFQRPIDRYEDANADGIITSSEVVMGDTAVFVGESVPPRSLTFLPVVRLFDGRVRASALFERRSGFTLVNTLERTQCDASRCRARVDPTTPLDEQAEANAIGYTFIEPGDFTRLREVTIAVGLPSALVRPLHVRSATLSLSGRNLALWTRFSGPDPESTSGVGDMISGTRTEGVPQGRSWALRLDIGF